MRYYKIMFDDENNNSDDIVCFAEKNYEEKYNVNQYDLNEGKYIDNWDNSFAFYYDCKNGQKPTDYLDNNLGWILVSPKFQEIIKSVDIKEVQFLPVQINELNNNAKLDDYCVLNITTLSDALDLKNSIYMEIETEDEKLTLVTKYALNEKKLNALHLVRLRESKFSTFVSETVKNKLEEVGVDGCCFLEVKVI